MLGRCSGGNKRKGEEEVEDRLMRNSEGQKVKGEDEKEEFKLNLKMSKLRKERGRE